MGASSTGGGTTDGREGSGVASWTQLSLGTLRRDDGDEDLAPRVLAMVGQRSGRRCMRLGSGEEVRRRVAMAWLLFGTFLKFK